MNDNPKKKKKMPTQPTVQQLQDYDTAFDAWAASVKTWIADAIDDRQNNRSIGSNPPGAPPPPPGY